MHWSEGRAYVNIESNEKQMIEEALASGVSPVTFSYQDVVFFQKETHLVRTSMVFNSVDLGTLTMKEYRFVARRTKQGINMVKRHVIRMLRLIPKFLEKFPLVEYFTIPVYPRMVMEGWLVRVLYDAFAQFPGVHPSRMCIEIPADILYEDMETVTARLGELREFGVKVAISEVGDEYCPLFKLTGLPIDLIILDKYTTDMLEDENADRTLEGLVKYLHSFGTPVIAPELDSNQKIDNAKLIECDGYSAIHVAGSFGAPRSEEEADESVAEEAVAEGEAADESAADETATAEETADEATEAPAEEATEEVTDEVPTEEATADETAADETAEELAESEQDKEYAE